MAGRPRTQHKRIKAVLDRLEAIEDQIIASIPDQYDDTTIDNSSLPYDDLGRVWRESVEGVSAAVMQLEWLECLLDTKAKKAEQLAPQDEADELGDSSDLDDENPPALDGVAEPAARNAAPVAPDAETEKLPS